MARDTDRYDFFVSYATRDNSDGWITGFVDGILDEHRKLHGGRDLTYFFDKREIRHGDDWPNTLHHGIAESRVLVAFISPNYFASEWCRKEWRGWIDTEIAKHVFSDGAVPVYLVEVPGFQDAKTPARTVCKEIANLCKLPTPHDAFLADVAPLVSQLRRRQFQTAYALRKGHDASSDAELRQVLAEVAKDLNHRTERVRRAGESASTVPPYNTRFSGRVDELLTLRERLKSDRSGVLCGLHGLGGIGKTELAFAYAHAFAAAYPGGRLLVPCDGKTTVREASMALGDFADFRAALTDEERKTATVLFAAISSCLSRRLEEKGNILLILDNVTHDALMTRQEIDELTKLGPALHLLMTTRLAPPSGGSWITVGELSEVDAMELLEKHRAFSSDEEREAAQHIVKRLGGFAIAVELVGAWLAVHEGSNYVAIATSLGLEELETIASDETVELRRHNHERRLTAVLEPVLASLNNVERRLLEMSAFLPADTVALPWLKLLVERELPNAFVATGLIGDQWLEVCSRLTKLALFSRTGEADQMWRVRVHRLVQDVVKHRMSPGRLAECQHVVDTLVRDRADAMEAVTKWESARWEIEALNSLSVLWAAASHPGAAWLLSQAGWRWYQLAEWARAEPPLRQGLALCEAALPADHPEVAIHLNKLAALLMATNRLAEAEPLMRRALRIDEKHYGVDHPDVARDLNNLAHLLKEANRLSEAELMVRRALAIEEARYGHDSHEVVSPLGNLAGLLQATNRLKEAEPLMRRALQISEAHKGPEDPDVAIRLNNLAQLLQETGRLAEAERLMRRALAINGVSYGPGHPLVAANLNNLAQLLQVTKQFSEAESLLRNALEINEARYGCAHPRVAVCLDNLALLLHATKRFDEAEPLMRRAIEIEEASYLADHPETATSLNNLALLLQSTNRFAEAEALSRRALQISTTSYGVDHPDVARDLNTLAITLLKTNRSSEAEPLMRRHLALPSHS